jgi:lipopolysaccharide transport system permease protein
MSLKARTLIAPSKGLQLPSFRELLRYRDLFRQLIVRDITVQYKNTLLGFAWAVINPLLSTLLFYVIFRRLAKVSTDNVPASLFYLTGLLPWTYFSQALAASNNSLISASGLLSKIYFPRLFIPMAPIISRLADFLISFFITIVCIKIYGWQFNSNLLYLPISFLFLAITTAGFGLWLSSLSFQFRDVRFVVVFLIQFMLYAAPIVWPASLLPASYRMLYGFYPLAGIVESFRSCLLGTPMPWDLIWPGALTSLFLLVTAILYFGKVERRFADLI